MMNLSNEEKEYMNRTCKTPNGVNTVWGMNPIELYDWILKEMTEDEFSVFMSVATTVQTKYKEKAMEEYKASKEEEAMKKTTTTTNTTNTNTTINTTINTNKEESTMKDINTTINAITEEVEKQDMLLQALVNKGQLSKEDYLLIAEKAAEIANLIDRYESLVNDNDTTNEETHEETPVKEEKEEKKEEKKEEAASNTTKKINVNDMSFRELQKFAKEENLPVKRGGKGVTTEVLRASIIEALKARKNNTTTTAEGAKKEEKAPATKKTTTKEDTKATATKEEEDTTTDTTNDFEWLDNKVGFTAETTLEELHDKLMGLTTSMAWTWATKVAFIDFHTLPVGEDKALLIRAIEVDLFDEYFKEEAHEAIA